MYLTPPYRLSIIRGVRADPRNRNKFCNGGARMSVYKMGGVKKDEVLDLSGGKG